MILHARSNSVPANVQRRPGVHEGAKFQLGYEGSNKYRSTTNQQIHGCTADVPLVEHERAAVS
jgi:hypothetical protein